MIAVILAALLAQAADAPTLPPVLIDDKGNVRTITGVEPLEPGTRCLTPGASANAAGAIAGCEAELAKLKESRGAVILPVAAFVAIVAGAVAVGVAVGVGATLAAQPRR